MKKPLVIYHGNCLDGFAAAWAIHTEHPDWEFRPGQHGRDPDLNAMRGRDVYLVDFSYKLDAMRDVIAAAESVTVLDHHETAQEDLQVLIDEGAVDGEFDMSHSGARLAWDWFRPTEPLPAVLARVEDRDLWNWALPHTREVCAALRSYPMTFKVWDGVVPGGLHLLKQEGMPLCRVMDQQVEQIVATADDSMIWDGQVVPVANCPPWLASEVGHVLSEGRPFSATYSDNHREGIRMWSLRSRPDGAAVSAIAKKRGGGGHRHAAGFVENLEEH